MGHDTQRFKGYCCEWDMLLRGLKGTVVNGR